jgi:multidrug efflux system outer membrane protein
VSARRLGLFAALLASGCTSMAPRYERPAPPVPAAFPAGEAYPPAPAEAAPPALDRDAVFTDPRLQALIAQALENNRDLRVAAANILRARAQFTVQGAAQLPGLDANAGLQRVENAAGSATTASANLAVPAWEIDLFGRLQSLTDAAQQRYFASEATARATRLALIGDIANGWLAYGADSSLLALAQATAESARQTVDLVRTRFEGGIASRTDLAQAITILSTAESDLARQKTAVAQDRNLLTLLVGAGVEDALLPASIEQAGDTVVDPQLALSTEILLRRPDVSAAEFNLRAANADIGAARAALFPKITLSGLVGLAGGSLEGLFGDAGRSVVQGAGAANYPIFRAGAGRANLAASRAQRDALLAAYEKSVQTAFREVSDALARRGTIADQLGADASRAQAASLALALSGARYRGGVDSFLQNLDSQRSAYAAQRALIATQLEAARNRVALYRTLGGDALSPADGPSASE